jgi:hypothetical protein
MVELSRDVGGVENSMTLMDSGERGLEMTSDHGFGDTIDGGARQRSPTGSRRSNRSSAIRSTARAVVVSRPQYWSTACARLTSDTIAIAHAAG